MPKISVIVPIYGVEKYLKEAIDSILNQTMNDLEIILLDDGGKDACPQIIDEYAQKDNRIIAIHKQNGGYGQTMNVGLEKATGEYIAILEPDDYIESKMYEDLYKIAKKFDSDIVKSCFYDNLQAKEEQRILKTKWDDDKIPQDRSFKITECGLFLQYHPSIWSCIYKKEFLDKHNIKFVEAPGAGWTDNPFQVQTMCLAERINYTPNAYYYWRRLNKDESDDLKDYTIPFKRTKEIHEWLEKNNINSKEILLNLYLREIAYISIVLGIKSLINIDDALRLINKAFANIDKDMLLSSNNVRNSIKKHINLIYNNPLKYRKKILFKKFKQNLISIRWSRREKRIILFGKTRYKKTLVDRDEINICFTCDNRYVQHLICTLTSIILNKKNMDKINIYIVDGGIDKKNKKLIKKHCKDCDVQFLKVDKSLFNECPYTKEAFHVDSLATYYRFVLPRLINCDKILYLDCDTIISDSLSELYKSNISDYYFAGVPDVYEEENCTRLNISKYCNAGVLLINLKLWRDEKIDEKLFSWCATNKEKIMWMDQDVINVVCSNKIKYLPIKYNTQVSILEFGATIEHNKNVNSATIIHYVGHIKPWNKNANLEFLPYLFYWKYLKRTSYFALYFILQIRQIAHFIFSLKNVVINQKKYKQLEVFGIKFRFKKDY